MAGGGRGEDVAGAGTKPVVQTLALRLTCGHWPRTERGGRVVQTMAEAPLASLATCSMS